jgi:transposase-like protein
MMGRQRTPAERAALAARIVALATDPELTHAIIAQRRGCGKGLVREVLREAREARVS